MSTFTIGSRARDRRVVARAAVASGGLTVVLLLGALVVAPSSEQPGLLLVTGLAGGTLALAALSLARWSSARVLSLAGIALMSLGIAAGATLPDGLDAAAVVPLLGAVLTLPVLSGRPLLAVFALAFATSMVGEAAAYLVGGMAHVEGIVSVPLSLAATAVMLALLYGLVWWVSQRWRQANMEAARALASQRRLLEVNERLLSTLDPHAVLNLIADSLKAVVPYDNLTIYRVDRDAGLFRAALARDRFAPLILDTSFPLDRGITGWVVQHGEAQCVNDSLADPRTSIIPGTPAEQESLMVVPLVASGAVVGTLNVGRMGGIESHFSAEEFDLAKLFASQASIALQNAELHSAVWQRAETDALTGLGNRGAFEQRLEAMLADPAAQPTALVMLDLDGFKDYNDRYGHPAGDAILRDVGGAIASAVRTGDLSFRYGGDEFAIVLPRTSSDAAAHVAARVREAVGRMRLADGGFLTVSAGIACPSPRGESKEELVAAADADLYESKQAAAKIGRGRGTGSSPMPDVPGHTSRPTDASHAA